MNAQNNYQQVYKNTGTVPRTMGQAYKNVEYAVPIYRQKSEAQEAWEFIADAVVGFVYVAIVVVVVLALAKWLGVV